MRLPPQRQSPTPRMSGEHSNAMHTFRCRANDGQGILRWEEEEGGEERQGTLSIPLRINPFAFSARKNPAGLFWIVQTSTRAVFWFTVTPGKRCLEGAYETRYLAWSTDDLLEPRARLE